MVSATTRTIGWALLVFAATVARADRMREIAEIHLVALGGADRVAALGALKAEGRVAAGGRLMGFSLLAARPDRIRIETADGVRKSVQGYDGAGDPWELDLGKPSPVAQPMAKASAKVFVADAEFDDPLVAGEARRYTLDFAGDTEVDGRKLFRVLVTQKLTSAFHLLVDAESYLILMRIEERDSAGGRKVQVMTRYEDYRPVAGVLLPHRLTTVVDGKATQQIRIDRMTGNPTLPEGVFSMPPPPPPESTPAAPAAPER